MEREHLGEDSDWRLTLMPSKKKHLCHAIMPNVRIALAILRSPYHLYAEGLNCAAQFRGWKFAMTDDSSRSATAASSPERKQLTPAAKRALAEAEARKKAAEANAMPMAKEFQGPKGPEPTRYGDWENKGIASDF
jgi:hypothetical protein